LTGLVSLVGAGPGDPELLTVRAARRLGEADLVLYDALVSRDVLGLAVRAQCFSVAKRAGRPSVSQETIHRLMIRGARRGRRVVRLKGGDPFVLGRGGEEVLALTAAGIPVEVVPGVTSAVAAPALGGIPVTHRGLASAFVVLSGHEEAAFGPVLDGLSPGSLTVVVLMGLGTRRAIASKLLVRGWAPETPTAILQGASTAHSSSWFGTLRDMAAWADPELESTSPGTIVIGAVVGLSAALGGRAWADASRPPAVFAAR
jgi:uroporphyrin-III C-methyltransferase/precorrin-2 dehydrogenase/sirohydrochlorin ferrochelatase